MKWKDKLRENKWYANMRDYEVVFEELEGIIYIITVYPAEARK